MKAKASLTVEFSSFVDTDFSFTLTSSDTGGGAGAAATLMRHALAKVIEDAERTAAVRFPEDEVTARMWWYRPPLDTSTPARVLDIPAPSPLAEVATLLGCTPDQVPARVRGLLDEQRGGERSAAWHGGYAARALDLPRLIRKRVVTDLDVAVAEDREHVAQVVRDLDWARGALAATQAAAEDTTAPTTDRPEGE